MKKEQPTDPMARAVMKEARQAVRNGLADLTEAISPTREKDTSPEQETVSGLLEGVSKGASAAAKGAKRMAKSSRKDHKILDKDSGKKEHFSARDKDAPKTSSDEVSSRNAEDSPLVQKEETIITEAEGVLNTSWERQEQPEERRRNGAQEYKRPERQLSPNPTQPSTYEENLVPRPVPEPVFRPSGDISHPSQGDSLHTIKYDLHVDPGGIHSRADGTVSIPFADGPRIQTADYQASTNPERMDLVDQPIKRLEQPQDPRNEGHSFVPDFAPQGSPPHNIEGQDNLPDIQPAYSEHQEQDTLFPSYESRRERRSEGVSSSTSMPVSGERRDSPLSVRNRHVDEQTLKTGEDAPINSLESSPAAQKIHNETPPLTSSASSGVQSVHTVSNTASSEALGEAAGQAGAQAAGEAGASATAGAASGGTTVAVEVATKVVDKIKETVQSAAHTVREEPSRVKGLAVLVFFPLVFLAVIAGSISGLGSASNRNLSDNVLALMPQIIAACQRHNIPEYAPLVAAVMMQESGGDVNLVHGDVMMCAEAMGYPVFTPVPVDDSIDYGTGLLADLLQQANSQGPDDIPAISLAIQSYNFGPGFLYWARPRGGYTKENAIQFAAEQAAAMGWSSYGDEEYVDHVLRYYLVSDFGSIYGDSVIENGFFAYPYPDHGWDTYGGHSGVDISWGGCYGQPIYAAADGVVSYIQTGRVNNQGAGGNESYGNFVKLVHGNGWSSIYAHMSSVAVSPGDYVVQGQILGYIGDSGNAYGDHLHLELKDPNGNSRNGSQNWSEIAWPQHRG